MFNMSLFAIPVDDYDDETRGHIVGEIRADIQTGYIYRFVKVGQALAADQWTDGEVIVHKTTATWEGTNDVSTSTVDATYPVGLGIAVSTVPESTASVTYYTWVLIRGYHAAVLVTGDTGSGDELYASTTDGKATNLAGTATDTADGVRAGVFGRASAADVGNATVAAFVDFRF